MSLINDVLRELDRRGAPAPLPLPAVAAAPPPRRRRHRLVATLVVAVVALPLIGGWLLQRLPSAARSEPAADVVASAPASDRADDAVASTPSIELPSASADSAAAAPIDRAGQPAAADRASDRSPPDAGAAVAAAPPVQRQPEPIEVEQRAPASAEAASAPAAAGRVSADPTAPLASAGPEGATPAVEPMRLSIRRRTAAADADDVELAGLIRQADAALAARRDDEAGRLLRLVLARAPAQHRSRLALARLLLERQRRADAIRLLDDGLQIDPHAAELAEWLGRLLLEAGDPVRAAAVLAGAAPALVERPAHHALLAAAWQQAGESAQAAATYRALLAHDSRNGAWWLGLALAEDALGEPAAARAAFERARLDRSLEASVRHYIEQRIGQLGSAQ